MKMTCSTVGILFVSLLSLAGCAESVDPEGSDGNEPPAVAVDTSEVQPDKFGQQQVSTCLDSRYACDHSGGGGGLGPGSSPPQCDLFYASCTRRCVGLPKGTSQKECYADCAKVAKTCKGG